MLENTIKSFLKKGREKELELIKLLKQSGLKMIQSTIEEDKREHWDIKITQDIKIDVKGLRKTQRSNDKPNENIHWIEIKNVNGNKGSLYGDANFFAFETIDYWIFVDKNKLQDFIAHKCKDKIKTNTAKDALYKLYTRKDRKDVITQVKTLDLCSICDVMLKK